MAARKGATRQYEVRRHTIFKKSFELNQLFEVEMLVIAKVGDEYEIFHTDSNGWAPFLKNIDSDKISLVRGNCDFRTEREMMRAADSAKSGSFTPINRRRSRCERSLSERVRLRQMHLQLRERANNGPPLLVVPEHANGLFTEALVVDPQYDRFLNFSGNSSFMDNKLSKLSITCAEESTSAPGSEKPANVDGSLCASELPANSPMHGDIRSRALRYYDGLIPVECEESYSDCDGVLPPAITTNNPDNPWPIQRNLTPDVEMSDASSDVCIGLY